MSFTPFSSATFLSLARTCSSSVMSASSQMVTSATRLEASAIRFATVRRMPRRGIFSTEPYASASAPACGAVFAATVSTSSFVMRPPGPVPFTLARSICICLAKARTAGVACTGRTTSTTSLSPSVPTTVPESFFSASNIVACSPPASMVVRTSPTLIISPSLPWSCVTFPV